MPMAHRTARAPYFALVAILLAASPAWGQEATTPVPAGPGEASAPPGHGEAPGLAPAAPGSVAENAIRAMRELMHLLEKKGIIRPEDVERMTPAEARVHAVEDLARYLFVRGHLTPAQLDGITAWVGAPGAGAGPRAFSELVRGLFEQGILTDGDLEAFLSPEGVRRVTYVPELVKVQLREQVRREIVEQLEREGWATRGAVPEWVKRFRFRGDARYRYERILYPSGNVPMLDFNAINTGSPVNTNLDSFVDITSERWINVDQDRTRTRLRARVGFDADVTSRVVAAFRVAAGDNSSPVSTNQTLGGSGGNFSKYQLWIDRAAVRVDASTKAGSGVVAQIGRFESPFLSTDLVWDEDVNFDGLAAKATAAVGKGKLFVTAGAFPLFSTPLDFAAQDPNKFPSSDKWLYAAQAGVEWRPVDRFGLKLAAAFNEFHGVQGRASSPCDTNIKGVECDTDATRPSFAQKGNTYFPLRTPSLEALNQEAQNPTGTARYEFFGLASDFQVLTGTLRLDATMGALRLGLDGEFAWNVGFRRSAVERVAFNNCNEFVGESCVRFAGGDMGGLGRISVGSPTLARRGDWNLALTYRYVETDATLDAFVDSDFGLGGTNLKGFGLTGSAALAQNVLASVRWMSADQVTGAPFRVDVLQVDLSARY
jgi:Putative porin